MSYNSSCDVGYTGGNCLFDEDITFFQKGLHYCDSCENLWIYIIVVFFFRLVILRFVILMVSERKDDKYNFVIIKMITTDFQTLDFINFQKDLINMPDFLFNIFGIQIP